MVNGGNIPVTYSYVHNTFDQCTYTEETARAGLNGVTILITDNFLEIISDNITVGVLIPIDFTASDIGELSAKTSDFNIRASDF